MKKIRLLSIGLMLAQSVLAQCSDILFTYSNVQNKVSKRGSIEFNAFNRCLKPKEVLFSIEYLDSLNQWQEFDTDIFTTNPMGMKTIKLSSKKSRKFYFKVADIDTIMFTKVKAAKFRIVANIYSDDLVQISKIKKVCVFTVSEN